MSKVTFISAGKDEVSVAGIAGASIMQLATANGVPGIDAECGGSMSCATCHVYIEGAWLEAVGEPGEGEKVMLAFAEKPAHNSRLSCQILYTEVLNGITVHIPESQ